MEKNQSTKYQTKLADIEVFLDIKVQLYDELSLDLVLDNKSLEKANKEQASLSLYVDQQRVELEIILEVSKLEVGRVRGRLYRSYTEKSSRDLTETGKKQYIEGHEDYINARAAYLEISELHGKFQALSHSYISRGYSLRNITNARVAAIADTLL